MFQLATSQRAKRMPYQGFAVRPHYIGFEASSASSARFHSPYANIEKREPGH